MARTTAMMIALVLLSRVLGVAREIVLGQFYGQNQISDVYRAAFAVPDLLSQVVAGGALSSVFIPVFAEYWNAKREADAWRTFGAVMAIVGVIVAIGVVILEIYTPQMTRLTTPLFSPAARAATVPLTRILLPAQWCFFVGGLMMGTLNVRGRFLAPALGPVIYNLFIIAGGLVGAQLFPGERYPVLMAWGALLGAVLGNLLLPWWDLHRIGARWDLCFDYRHPGAVRVGKLMLPVLLGLSMSQLNMWLTRLFLREGGHYSALYNAYTLTQAPIGIFAQALAIVLFPTISTLAAAKDWKAFGFEVDRGIRNVLFLTIPASIIMAVLAEPLVRLLFLGRKFGEPDVLAASGALLFYSLGTFAWSAQAVLARGFYAMQDTRTPILVSTPMVGLFIGLCFVLQATRLGYLGLALATSVVATLTMGIYLALLIRRVGGLSPGGIAASTARITAASLASGGAAWLVLHALQGHIPLTRLGALPLVLAGGSAAALVYVAVCALLHAPELRSVMTVFRRRVTLPAG